MNKNILLRIAADLLLTISILNGWWFIALPLVIIAIWFFPYFIESIVAGIAYDSLFGFQRQMGVWGYIGTIVSVILFVGITMAKRRLR